MIILVNEKKGKLKKKVRSRNNAYLILMGTGR